MRGALPPHVSSLLYSFINGVPRIHISNILGHLVAVCLAATRGPPKSAVHYLIKRRGLHFPSQPRVLHYIPGGSILARRHNETISSLPLGPLWSRHTHPAGNLYSPLNGRVRLSISATTKRMGEFLTAAAQHLATAISPIARVVPGNSNLTDGT